MPVNSTPINAMISLAKYGYLIIAALMSLLGIALLADPDFPMASLCTAGGWLLILFGIVKLIGYCSRDLYRLAFEHDLSGGLAIIILGIFILLRQEKLMSLVILVLGIVILADACAKVQIALDSKSFGIQKWYWILIAAAVTGAVGLILILRTSAGFVITGKNMGIALIAEAIQNCTTILIAVKIIKTRQISTDSSRRPA